MAKPEVGGILPDFEYQTPYEKGLHMAETAEKAPKTAIVFLRYYGCPFCQYDMMQYKESYEKITSDGGQFLVVLQSDPAKLAQKLEGNELPYPVICDPEQILSKEFEVRAGESREDFMGEKTMKKIEALKGLNLEHGEYEGNEAQLPGTIVIDNESKVIYIHYADCGGDSPTAEELAQLLTK